MNDIRSIQIHAAERAVVDSLAGTGLIDEPAKRVGPICIAVNTLVDVCHGASSRAGWWLGPDDLDVIRLLRNPGTKFERFLAGAIYAQKLMLTVSELAESMEGDRKSLPDDKLPQFPMRVVEIADAMIRAADLAGAVIPPDAGYTMGDVITAKLAFNAQRPDHKAEARAQAGGKAY